MRPLLLWGVLSVVLFVFFTGSALLAVWAEGGEPRVPLGLFLLVCAGISVGIAGVAVAIGTVLRRGRGHR